MERVNNGSLSTTKYTTVYKGEIPEGELVPDTYVVAKTPVNDAARGALDTICTVKFQCGPIKEAGVNGVANEDLINMVIDRLKGFQNSKYACEENAEALKHFQEGLMWLRKRTLDRELRGVEGTNKI